MVYYCSISLPIKISHCNPGRSDLRHDFFAVGFCIPPWIPVTDQDGPTYFLGDRGGMDPYA